MGRAFYVIFESMADTTGRLMAAAGYAPTILNEGRYRTYLYESPFHWERLEGSYVPSHFRRAYLREDGYLIAELNNGRGWKLYKVNKRKIAETVVVMQRSGNWPRSLAQRYADDYVAFDIPHIAPPGWSGSVQACIEHHPEINNPFALLWGSYRRGYKSHYDPHLVSERHKGILHKSWKRRINRIRKRQQLGESIVGESAGDGKVRVHIASLSGFDQGTHGDDETPASRELAVKHAEFYPGVSHPEAHKLLRGKPVEIHNDGSSGSYHEAFTDNHAYAVLTPEEHDALRGHEVLRTLGNGIADHSPYRGPDKNPRHTTFHSMKRLEQHMRADLHHQHVDYEHAPKAGETSAEYWNRKILASTMHNRKNREGD